MKTSFPCGSTLPFTRRAVASMGETTGARCGTSSGTIFSTYCTTAGQGEEMRKSSGESSATWWNLREYSHETRSAPKATSNTPANPAACSAPTSLSGGMSRKAAGKEGASSAQVFPGVASKARTWSSEERTRFAPWEQARTHHPQEMQNSSMISACPPFTWRAFVGQERTQE